MYDFEEVDVSRSILDAYHGKFQQALQSDVVLVGAGPSGLVAAWRLAQNNLRVVILEKRLSPGGGIWGGSLGMNEVVVQKEALPILQEAGVRNRAGGRLFTADAMELASALCLKSLHAGAILLNLMMAEDVCVRGGRVTGVVANRSMLGESLPIDPIAFSARTVIDATGHEAYLANCLQKRGLLKNSLDRLPGEGPMDASSGERFVEESVSELYPGLWMTGMSVCASMGGPRMGPIFGGMLLSGVRVANMVLQSLAGKNNDDDHGLS
ncbi:MAG: thiazole biosynthesis protein [Acidobacteria bacterium]|nr:thiazole biosynthesis protein [Acidobacteriota bacterium]